MVGVLHDKVCPNSDSTTTVYILVVKGFPQKCSYVMLWFM